MSGKRAARVENVTLPVSALVPHSRNYNRHSDAQINDLRESLRQFGQVRSIVVQPRGKKFVIVAGHGIAQAAQAEGFTQLRADVIPASWSETRVLAYLAADNELARHGDPDQDQLAAIVREVMEAEGEALARLAAGEQSALDAILNAGNATEETADAGELVDKAAELQKKWQVQRGDVWEIGRHRLMCGDSTSAEDVKTLLDGNRANLCLTDLPYGNDTQYGTYKDTQENLQALIALVMPVILKNCDVALIACGVGNIFLYPAPAWVLSWNWENTASGSSHWGFNNWQPILAYGKDPYLANGKGRRQDAIRFNGIAKVDAAHPCPKPPEVWTWFLERGSINQNDVVLDVFNGSGTTLVACEQTGRIGRGMEIEPKYCAVTLERLSLLGLTPHRVTAAGASRRSDTTKRGRQAQTKAAPQKQNTSRRPLAVDSGT